MGPLAMMGIGAGLGILKSQTIDKQKEKKARELAAATQRYAPWTGLKAGPIEEADALGSALKYGATGASMGAGIQEADLNEALAKRLNSGGNVAGYGHNFTKDDIQGVNPWSLNGYQSKYLGSF